MGGVRVSLLGQRRDGADILRGKLEIRVKVIRTPVRVLSVVTTKDLGEDQSNHLL